MWSAESLPLTMRVEQCSSKVIYMSPNGRNLVVARTGKSSLHANWLEGSEPRTWALQLSCFIEGHTYERNGDLPISYDTGTKWDSICRYIEGNPQIADQYDFICFPDDDLLMDQNQLNGLFSVAKSYNIGITTPALTWDSYFSHPITLKSSSFLLRWTNFAEAMCPVFPTKVFLDIFPVIRQFKSGWGLDMIWSQILPAAFRRTAIVDQFAVRHTRPLQTGTIYASLAQQSVSPMDEYNFAKTLHPFPENMDVSGGILTNKKSVGEIHSRILNAASMVQYGLTRQQRRIHTLRTAGGMLRRIPSNIRLVGAKHDI
jgi:hypothetical protein